MDDFPLDAVMELLGSDSEDEEADEVLYAAAAHLLRLDRNRIPKYYGRVVSSYYDFEFKRLFRLSLEMFQELACKFEASDYFPSPRGGRVQIPAEKTCLIGLTYLGTQTCMYRIADNFDMSESSVSLCLKRFLDFLFNISGDVIAWPSERQRQITKAKFLARSKGKGPRDTIGSVDGSHKKSRSRQSRLHLITTERSSLSFCKLLSAASQMCLWGFPARPMTPVF